MTITLQKKVRDCRYNATQPRKQIHDFEVLIDGELRAIWKHRAQSFAAFTLQDLNGRLLYKSGGRMITCRSSNQMDERTKMHVNCIP